MNNKQKNIMIKTDKGFQIKVTEQKRVVDKNLITQK